MKLKFYRVWYAECGKDDEPVRSDIVIKAYGYGLAWNQALVMFQGFRIIKLERDVDIRFIT